jgi:hypothetical protein
MAPDFVKRSIGEIVVAGRPAMDSKNTAIQHPHQLGQLVPIALAENNLAIEASIRDFGELGLAHITLSQAPSMNMIRFHVHFIPEQNDAGFRFFIGDHDVWDYQSKTTSCPIAKEHIQALRSHRYSIRVGALTSDDREVWSWS